MSKFKKDADKLDSKKLEIQAKLNIDDASFDMKLKEIERKRQIEIQANMVNGRIDDTKSLKINNKYDSLVNALDMQMSKNADLADLKLKQIEAQLIKNKSRQNELNNSIDEMNKKLEEVRYNTDEVENSGKNVVSTINETIKKVGKWTLAIFGVRSAYMAVRKAMSVLSQYNEEMAVNIEYITYALANTLKPVIETIINLVAKLLAYINYLSKAWFGKELFASAKAFNDMKKSSAGISKNVEKAQDALTSFDDINKLEDSTSDSSGGSNITAPTIDLANLDDIEIPKWLQNFEKFCEPIISFCKDLVKKYGPTKVAIVGIVGALGGFIILKKIIGWIKDLKSGSKTVSTFFDSFGKALGIIALLGGIALVVQSLSDLINTFSQSGMTLGEVAGLLGIVLGELSIAFIALYAAIANMEPSWQSIAGAAVIFAGLVLVLESLNKLFKTIEESGMSVGDVGLVLTEVIGSLIALVTALTLASEALQSPLAMGGLAVLAASISAILLVVAATLPIILDACAKFINDVGPFIIQLITTINDGINETIESLGTSLPPIIKSIGDLFKSIFNGVATVINTVGGTIVNILTTAQSLVKTVLSSILDFINNLGPAINNFVDNAISAVTKLINFIISGIEYTINTLIIGAINGLLKGINKIPGVDFDLIKDVKIARFSPKLAGGGIVDVPRTGVKVGRAIAGEAGAEGVFPFENEEVMARAGREIGKWVTINIDLTNEIDGRVLNRILKTIQNGQNFSRNGG